MSKRDDNLLYSVSGLSVLTGVDRRTIDKRLSSLDPESGPANGKYYDTRKALPLIFGLESDSAIDKKMVREQLKYETQRAERARIEVERLKGNLVPIEDVAKIVDREYSAVRAHLIAIPSKIAMDLCLLDEPGQVRAKVEDAINEALRELSSDRFEIEGEDEQYTENASDGADESQAASVEAQTQDEPGGVGGPL